MSREQFKHLGGVEIGISQAANKYAFSVVVISDWVRRGQVQFIRQLGSRKLINEADVAYARALADIKGLRSGRPLFGRRSKEKAK